MSLHKFAEQVAANGRGDDSLLVHMTPDEVRNLQKFAQANGTTLTINPETGLPEAGLLSDLFKAVAPMALGAFLGPAGVAFGGPGLSAAMAGLATGGITALATGSLSRGLMAGLGAYGGAGLGESLMNAGTGAMSQIAGAGLGEEAAQQAVSAKLAAATPMETLTTGFNAATATPSAMGTFAKQNLGNLAYAASPILAGSMVPTTTQMPSSTDTGYIRQKVFDPGTQTYRSLDPIKANEWKDRSFSDIYRGYNGGGIVALAAGGTGQTVADLYASIGRTPDAEGQKFWESAFGTGPVSAAQAASFMESANAVKAKEAAAATGAAADTTGGGNINFSSNVGNTTGATDTSGIAALTADTNTGATTGATDTSGIATLNNTGQTVADLYASIGRTPDAEGLAFWQSAFGTGPVTADQAASFMQSANAVKANEAAAATGANVNTVGGGVTNLATTGGATTGATDTSGIAALTANTNTGATTGATSGTSVADAKAAVNNIYQNVLGRDADAVGLNFWSNAIANGRSVDSVYQDILASARQIKTAGTLGNFDINALTAADAAKPYTGYTSTASNTVADEWVRNVIGREPTVLEKTLSWYKDSFNLGTTAEAAKIYKDFKDYAASKGKSTDLSWMEASQLKAPSTKKADTLVGGGGNDTIVGGKGNDTVVGGGGNDTIVGGKGNDTVVGGTVADTVASGFYGNETTPGDLTRNADRTVTVQPNIPYRPPGGFSGMEEVRNAYTAGGGNLGYTPRVIKTPAEHAAAYNTLTGDSEAAYNYLMGKGAYPTKSKVGEIMRPYKEATLGYAPSTNKPYTYDATTGKMVRNRDYVTPIRNAEGNVTYGKSLNDIKSYIDTLKSTGGGILGGIAGQISEAIAVPKWMAENNISYEQIAEALGISLAESRKRYPPAKKADTTTGNETPSKEGGIVGYAVGGGLGSLGSYSDGGRLLKGPGDGVSDSIPATIGRKQQPARLADGEFVVPARIVSELGNGSTEAGAKKLYAMMDRVQRARGKTTGKNKVAANSRADKYLPA